MTKPTKRSSLHKVYTVPSPKTEDIRKLLVKEIKKEDRNSVLALLKECNNSESSQHKQLQEKIANKTAQDLFSKKYDFNSQDLEALERFLDFCIHSSFLPGANVEKVIISSINANTEHLARTEEKIKFLESNPNPERLAETKDKKESFKARLAVAESNFNIHDKYCRAKPEATQEVIKKDLLKLKYPQRYAATKYFNKIFDSFCDSALKSDPEIRQEILKLKETMDLMANNSSKQGGLLAQTISRNYLHHSHYDEVNSSQGEADIFPSSSTSVSRVSSFTGQQAIVATI